jgi:hypothetical protein
MFMRRPAHSAQEVKRGDAVLGGALKPLWMGDGVAHVAHASLPVLFDHGPRELVIFRVELVGLVAIDQVDDVDGLVRHVPLQRRDRRVGAQRQRKFRDQLRDGRLQVHVGAHGVGIHARATRVGDVLLPLDHFRKRAWHRAARAEQVNLQDHQPARARIRIQHVLQRRVRKDAAVPVVLAVDMDGRKARRQRAAGHDVLDADALSRIVEIRRVARAHVHRSDTQANFAPVDPIEVDESLQRRLERCRVVVAQDRRRTAKHQQQIRAWPEKSRDTD